MYCRLRALRPAGTSVRPPRELPGVSQPSSGRPHIKKTQADPQSRNESPGRPKLWEKLTCSGFSGHTLKKKTKMNKKKCPPPD